MRTESNNLPQYLTRVQIKLFTGLTDEQIDVKMANGDFPDPVRFENHQGWLDHEIADWICRSFDAEHGGAR